MTQRAKHLINCRFCHEEVSVGFVNGDPNNPTPLQQLAVYEFTPSSQRAVQLPVAKGKTKRILVEHLAVCRVYQDCEAKHQARKLRKELEEALTVRGELLPMGTDTGEHCEVVGLTPDGEAPIVRPKAGPTVQEHLRKAGVPLCPVCHCPVVEHMETGICARCGEMCHSAAVAVALCRCTHDESQHASADFDPDRGCLAEGCKCLKMEIGK